MKTLEQIEAEIESMIDAATVQGVLQAVVNVCHAKADHIRENWQDKSLAKAWDIAARKVNNAQARLGFMPAGIGTARQKAGTP